MQNWTNDFGVFLLAMSALIVGCYHKKLRDFGYWFMGWFDEVVDEVNEVDDFGFIEQEFNK